MDKMKKPVTTIDEYIESFPIDVQDMLQTLRRTIKNSAPKAVEAISYQIPTFKLHGNLVHFAAYKHHIGFYPTSSPVKVFAKELTSYKTSKGAIQFPIGEPLPLALVRKIVRFRVKESTEKAKRKIK
ncbi:DUF1801 domain-containing protein [bacterium]|nr:MAG: DUF1801 domain-containing protein [bacterium]